MIAPVCTECHQSGSLVCDKNGIEKIHVDLKLGFKFVRYRCHTYGCKIRKVKGDNIIEDVIVKKEFVLSTE